MKAELRYTQSGSSLKSLWAVAAILFMLFGVGFVVGGGEDSKPANNPKSKNDTAPTTGTPDNELDKHVENEAKKYGDPPGDKKLLPPLKVTAKSPRTVSDMAARIDAILDRKREAAKIPASRGATDAEFLLGPTSTSSALSQVKQKPLNSLRARMAISAENLSRNYWPIRDTASTLHTTGTIYWSSAIRIIID